MSWIKSEIKSKQPCQHLGSPINIQFSLENVQVSMSTFVSFISWKESDSIVGPQQIPACLQVLRVGQNGGRPHVFHHWRTFISRMNCVLSPQAVEAHTGMQRLSETVWDCSLTCTGQTSCETCSVAFPYLLGNSTRSDNEEKSVKTKLSPWWMSVLPLRWGDYIADVQFKPGLLFSVKLKMSLKHTNWRPPFIIVTNQALKFNSYISVTIKVGYRSLKKKREYKYSRNIFTYLISNALSSLIKPNTNKNSNGRR